MACGGFDSVRCDAAACVGPGDAGATSCLSSTLDDAFAVPSRTAACLFGLDRLEDEAPRVKVPAARPAVAEEAAPVDDGDLVVPEMGTFGMVVVGALVYVAWKAYHACGKATTRAAAALPRRKSDASGPAFRWPEDKAPPPDVAGEDEKSPEDAVALVLFDGGGDGDRRADEAGAADAEERGPRRRADDHEAGDAEERGADAAARSDEEAPRARGRSATRGEGRSRSRSRSKSRSRSRRPGHGAMHRAPCVVKAKGAVVRDGVALDSDKVTRLAAGTEVVVTYAKQLPDKKTSPHQARVGWVRGAVAEARPARDDDDR
ncbi:hypothetical protein JL720_12043 [Aureococcus anophagefferens]|nr:hypothetical protein JL720_12043 [Aureococcus anophagefferens]